MNRLAASGFALIAVLADGSAASAHCDTTRGPVVTAARAALEAGNPKLVLHWVRPQDEPAIQTAFEHTRQVRALGPEAEALADRFFFETLVRIHRAGEGAPYTGLTDAEPEPIITATDRALERGSAEQLEQELVTAVRAGLAERFAAARAARSFEPGDVAGGRTFVAAYVELTHWVEGVFTAAHAEPGHHAAAAATDHGHTAARVASHGPGDHGTSGESPAGTQALHGEGAPATHLPWILAGLLAAAALVEGAFLLRRRRAAAS